ncbi:MAG TPA: Uma2 family endonuclease, partial [Bryobacteraceae bacterium]|nr:Uma2 family endonuclease [Bryobacteraceae bacterium]
WRLAGLIFELARRKAVVGCTELRLQLTPDTFRIPDVCIYTDEPAERVPTRPPLVVVEIVSPDDRYSELIQKLDEYEAWGVPRIWLIDPSLKTLTIYRDGTLQRVDQLALAELDFSLSPQDLFPE